MLNISQFFGRIRGKYLEEQNLISDIQKAIKEQTGEILDESSIKSKYSVIHLCRISSEARSHIFIRKQKILESINQNRTGNPIKDIR